MKIERRPGFLLASTLAEDGHAKDPAVQKKILESAGLSPERLVAGKQVHGDHIVRVLDSSVRLHPATDGLVTDQPGIVIGIFTADCAPLLLTDPARGVAAAVHAGWRGAQNGISARMVRQMRQDWGSDPADIQVWVGPHIRPCCYEVGEDVARLFPQECLKRSGTKIYLSLEEALARQLRQAGVAPQNMIFSPECTHCDRRFFSFRRDKCEERMLSLIVKTKEESHG